VIDDVIMTSHFSGYGWSEFTACNKSWSQGRHFLRVQGTCWCIDTVVSCIMWWNLRTLKKIFIY